MNVFTRFICKPIITKSFKKHKFEDIVIVLLYIFKVISIKSFWRMRLEKCLSEKTVNQKMLNIQYAVRGPILQRAVQIEREIEKVGNVLVNQFISDLVTKGGPGFNSRHENFIPNF